MEDILEFRYKSKIVEIVPNTKRNQELKAKRLAEENQKKAEAEKLRKNLEEQAQFREMQLKKQEKLKKLEEEKKKEELRRQQEEMQEINTLKGKFGNMINDLKTDSTPLEYTISGLNLVPIQISILVQATAVNNSLKTISMNRKKINDNEGVEVANCLHNNKQLENLILEGNNLGPLSAASIGMLLDKNTNLRNIDLEGNDLTNGGKDTNGIKSLAEALKKNTTLLCLNLTNTNLDAACSEILLDALKQNKTLILLDVCLNPKMNLKDVRDIQKIIEKNKLEYDNERFKEFMERKCLKREEEISSILTLKEETKQMMKEGIDKRIEAKTKQKEEEWKNKLIEEEVQRQKEILKLDKLAKIRAASKNRNRRTRKKK